MRLSSDIAAVVTGGASGLGKATVEKLRADGVKVAIFDRDEDRGKATAEELGATFCKVDVTSDDSVTAGFEAARKANGQERILVCCAGIGSAMKTASRSKDTGEIKHFPLNIFELTIQINLIGTFRCVAKSAAGILTLDPLESGERGAMVMTASVAAEDGQIGQAAYSASKGGVMALSQYLSTYWAEKGVRVNQITPHGVWNNHEEQFEKNFADFSPLKRMSYNHEVAGAAIFLLSDASSYVTGHNLIVDGGWTAW